MPSAPAAVVAKTKFSMCTEEVDAALEQLPEVRKVLVVGIETHVCVLQTSLDLLGALSELGRGSAGAAGAGRGRGRVLECQPAQHPLLIIPIEHHQPSSHCSNLSLACRPPPQSAERGYEVHILVDGVSSQRLGDRSVALQRLSQAGAFLATSEMALFQLMVSTAHPAFKAISALCKEARPEQLPPN